MRRSILILAVLVVGCVVMAAGMMHNAEARPVVVRYDVAVSGWPAALPPLRVVQLSDIHMGPPDMPVARVAAIVAQANALRPDLVVLTGDYYGGKLVEGGGGTLDDAIRPLRALRSRYGTFAIRGNHDNAWWAPRVLPRYHMTYLQNRHADAGPVVIAGVDDLITGAPDVATALRGIPPGKPVILLTHSPDLFPAVPASVALTLAGHTHGGQVKLPLIGTVFTNTLMGYVRGRYVVGGRTLIVSSGIGTSTLPIRLDVPPEIAVITLHGVPAPAVHSVGRNSGTDR